MKQKMILSIATAATLLMGTPGIKEADAAEPVYTLTNKVYVQTDSINQEFLNNLFGKYYQNYQKNWQSYKFQAPLEMKGQEHTVKESKPVQKDKASEIPTNQPSTAPIQEQPVHSSPTGSAESQVSTFEQQVIDLTNQERTKQGLPALKIDFELSKVAKAKSQDMQNNQYFNHTSPTYGSPFDMMKQFGISYRSAGENIAMGQRTPEEVVQAWMNSEGHRANILNSSYTHIGVGHVENGNYWTQMFIGK